MSDNYRPPFSLPKASRFRVLMARPPKLKYACCEAMSRAGFPKHNCPPQWRRKNHGLKEKLLDIFCDLSSISWWRICQHWCMQGVGGRCIPGPRVQRGVHPDAHRSCQGCTSFPDRQQPKAFSRLATPTVNALSSSLCSGCPLNCSQHFQALLLRVFSPSHADCHYFFGMHSIESARTTPGRYAGDKIGKVLQRIPSEQLHIRWFL